MEATGRVVFPNRPTLPLGPKKPPSRHTLLPAAPPPHAPTSLPLDSFLLHLTAAPPPAPVPRWKNHQPHHHNHPTPTPSSSPPNITHAVLPMCEHVGGWGEEDRKYAQVSTAHSRPAGGWRLYVPGVKDADCLSS